MRRGRTVQIKMSSATAWTGSMISWLSVWRQTVPNSCGSSCKGPVPVGLTAGCSVDSQCPRVLRWVLLYMFIFWTGGCDTYICCEDWSSRDVLCEFGCACVCVCSSSYCSRSYSSFFSRVASLPSSRKTRRVQNGDVMSMLQTRFHHTTTFCINNKNTSNNNNKNNKYDNL